MNITIKPGAATEDAAQIDSIIKQIEQDMQTLDAAIKKNIPDGVQTNWSETVRSNWEQYYSADIPDAMAQMSMSASNLRLAVEKALTYSQG